MCIRDRYTLVSNSDAQSPSKLGREANIFDSEVSYKGIKRALETKQGFLGTIEFFPEEGNYHLDGHRKCGLRKMCIRDSQKGNQGGNCCWIIDSRLFC